ncbi:MAG: 30S ribosomal protein S17 [Pseudomonadota bacterium]|nr:30S ribosomal protein S17 [Pseudomonadota bacterium]
MAEKTKVVRTETGLVTSDKMDKTIVVAVTRQVKHPIYGKYIKKTTKYAVHDEENTCKEGDTVRIREGRPISKSKSWVLDTVIERAA